MYWLLCIVPVVRFWHVHFSEKNRQLLARKCYSCWIWILKKSIQPTSVWFRAHKISPFITGYDVIDVFLTPRWYSLSISFVESTRAFFERLTNCAFFAWYQMTAIAPDKNQLWRMRALFFMPFQFFMPYCHSDEISIENLHDFNFLFHLFRWKIINVLVSQNEYKSI